MSSITQSLNQWQQGHEDALGDVWPQVYDELRRMARRRMRSERVDHTLTPTGLVHEAYLRLSRAPARHLPGSQAQFFALASALMRHILVDHARARRAAKRGDGQRMQSLDELSSQAGAGDSGELGLLRAGEEGFAQQILELDDAMRRLARIDPELQKVVECRFFGGLTVKETAQALSMSESSIKRHWVCALAWLRRDMRKPAPHPGE